MRATIKNSIKQHTADLLYEMDRLVNEDCRDETSEDLLGKTREVTNQEARLTGDHTKHDHHDPEADPTAPGKELQVRVRRRELRRKTTQTNKQTHKEMNDKQVCHMVWLPLERIDVEFCLVYI